MKKSLFLISCSVVLANTPVSNKKIVDCRFVTPNTTQCMPYPFKFMYTQKLAYDSSEQKLIISKTLPVVNKPKIMKTINVEDMIEAHLEVLDPVRFRGSMPSPLRESMEEQEPEAAKMQKEILGELEALKKKREELEILKKELEKEQNKTQPQEPSKVSEEKPMEYAQYTVKSGDFLNLIAKRFGVTTKEILAVNDDLKHPELLHKGQKLMLPLSPKEFDQMLEKSTQEAEAAQKTNKLAQKLEKKYLNLNQKTRNKVLNEYDAKLLGTLKGTHSLRVQTTAYTSHPSQTDDSPFIAAWGNRIGPGMKIIAVSRDLISKYGLGYGKKVKIQGLPGVYTVADKMNPRFTKRIDVYMGLDRRKALQWGRRRTIIYW